ncbi:MAG: prephenate dehydratase, partial [Bacteroidales bacterium]|nr:prephenate dehydratase [Bacteroidales bacterium]
MEVLRKIAIQGESGSFHEVAAKNYFGKNIEIIPCATFDQTLAETKAGRADFA